MCAASVATETSKGSATPPWVCACKWHLLMPAHITILFIAYASALMERLYFSRHRRDLVTNANALLVRIWNDDEQDSADQQEVCTLAGRACCCKQRCWFAVHPSCFLMLAQMHLLIMYLMPQAPAVHHGFLRRADAIPIEALFAEACRRGKRLVVCGCADPAWRTCTAMFCWRVCIVRIRQVVGLKLD